MEEVKLLWTYNEFKAYVLIYAAESNLVIKDEEKDFIEDQFDSLIIKSMKKEFDNDEFFNLLGDILVDVIDRGGNTIGDTNDRENSSQ